MLEIAWAALCVWIAAVLFFGLIASLRDGYTLVEYWRAGHKR
jgi:Na+/proline symporter